MAIATAFSRLIDGWGTDVPLTMLRPYQQMYEAMDEDEQFEFLLSVAQTLTERFSETSFPAVERAATLMVDWFLLPANAGG